MLNKYLDYKVFEFFRDRALPLVNAERKTPLTSNIYSHLFLAPESIGVKRNFQLRGVAYPYMCLWPTSTPVIDQKAYGRSVLPRDFLGPNGEYYRGRLVDFNIKYNLVAGSYFKTFVSSVDQDLTELDILRYFDIGISEYIPDFNTRAEVRRGATKIVSNVDTKVAQQSFTLSTDFTVSITLPLILRDLYLDAVTLYLNDNIIFESQENNGEST